jgi:hypothetical protein
MKKSRGANVYTMIDSFVLWTQRGSAACVIGMFRISSHSRGREIEGKNMVIGSIQPRSQQTYQLDDAGSPGAASNSCPAGYIPTNDNTYLTALVASSAAVPIVAAMITVAVYLAPFPIPLHLWIAVPLGAIITVIAWFLFAIPCRRFASAAYANRCSYGSLINQLRDLRARLHVLDGNAYAPPIDTCKIALEEARTWCDDIEWELKCKGLCWLLATGYINMWKLLHHAEEALIEIEPVDAVINKAVHDELCLQDSNIGNSEVLLDKLRIAVKKLSPSATAYLTKQPREQEASSDPQSKGNPNRSDSEMEARATLREVRRTLNEYRDDLWEGLIRTRNRLMMIVTITGFLAYILLSISIVSDVDPSNVVAATIFFLVGAIVGLFNRLHLETQINNAANDYGLSMARVIATPVLSGLAAVGSVLVIMLLTGVIQDGSKVLDDIKNIYIINPWHIVLAAIFGLAPNLLISMLQQKAESYKSDIMSSKAS